MVQFGILLNNVDGDLEFHLGSCYLPKEKGCAMTQGILESSCQPYADEDLQNKIGTFAFRYILEISSFSSVPESTHNLNPEILVDLLGGN